MKLILIKEDGTVIERQVRAGLVGAVWTLFAGILPMSDRIEVTVKGLTDEQLAGWEAKTQ
jgi:hypothetical protein